MQGAARSQAAGWQGALRRLRLFPLHSATTRLGIAQRLHARRTRRARAWLEAGPLAPLAGGQAAGALSQDPADLRYLYSAITNAQPRRTIEFGSGQSTLFIAQALHDLGAGHLWSLEADRHWLDHTAAMLPAHLSRYVTLVHSQAVLTDRYGTTAWRYSDVPPGEWDFAFIDGPPLTDDVRLSCDLIALAPKLTAGASGFIDHRWRTAVLAKEHLGDRLRFRYLPSLESFSFRRR